jgi:hypothetical protein
MWVRAKVTYNGIEKDKNYILVDSLFINNHNFYKIIDDFSKKTYYSSMNFYKKSEFREIKLDFLLN